MALGGILVAGILSRGWALEAPKPPEPAAVAPTSAAPTLKTSWSPTLAVHFLLKHQREDGSWPPGPQVNPDAFKGITVGTTALIGMALLEHGNVNPAKIHPAVQRAWDYVWKDLYRKPDGSKPGYGSPAWGQVYTIEFATRLIAHPSWNTQRATLTAALNEAVDWLLQAQIRHPKFPGVWGYAGSFHNAAAIIALQHAQRAGATVNQEQLGAAVTFLKAQRIEHKGFAYSKLDEELRGMPADQALDDSVARLVECEWALLQAGQSDLKNLERTFQQFMDHRTFTWNMRDLIKEGQAPRRGGASPYCWFAFFGYYYSTMGLEALPLERRNTWAPLLQQDLLAVLNEDGTWTNLEMPEKHNPHPGSRTYATAMGLLSMKALERALAKP